MKQIVLDHLKRWWGLWGLGAIFASAAGWLSATDPPPPDEIFVLPLSAMILGPVLLQTYLQRGFARTLATLPLTARQIGRGWWLAAVGLPAIVMSSLAFLSAGISYLIHPGGNFHGEWLAMNCIVSLLFLGTSFLFLMGFPNGRGGMRGIVWGVLLGSSIGGWFSISKYLFDSPTKTMWVLVIGTGLTIAGWFRAEQLVLNLAGFRLASQRSGKRQAQYKLSQGFSGIPLLATTMLTRILLGWLLFIAFMAGLAVLEGRTTSLNKFFESIIWSISFFSVWIIWMIIMFQTFPILLQLRLLRTLPLSTTTLAIVLVLLPVMSTLTLGGITAIFAFPVAGAAKSFVLAGNFLMTAALVALCIPMIFTRETFYLILFVMIFGLAWVQTFTLDKLPLSLVASISGLLVITSIFLTRKWLASSSEAYCVQPNPFNSAWDWGR